MNASPATHRSHHLFFSILIESCTELGCSTCQAGRTQPVILDMMPSLLLSGQTAPDGHFLPDTALPPVPSTPLANLLHLHPELVPKMPQAFTCGKGTIKTRESSLSTHLYVLTNNPSMNSGKQADRITSQDYSH